MIEIKMINGPLDGEIFDGDISGNRFIIVGAQSGNKLLYCCYEYKDGCLFFISTKMPKQIKDLNAMR